MTELLSHIEAGEWVPDNQNRRVQIFGYNFLVPEKEHVKIPEYFDKLRGRMEEKGYGKFEELLIAEYAPGVGVNPHIDRFFWSEPVVGISLLSSCMLELRELRTNEEILNELQPGSIYCLRGKSRYEFSHAIPEASVTARRISLTFRNLSTNKIIIPADTEEYIELL
jgi:alkylated DNA repair dioxygenase AlkB